MRVRRALTVVLLIAGTLPGMAAERRRAVAVPEDSLTISFVEADATAGSMVAAGSDAWLDLKSVSRMGDSNEKVIRNRRRFGLKIVRTGGVSGGSAVISVRLDSWDGRATYRLDGRALSAVPLVVDAHAAVGAITFHTLDVDVPVSVAEGPLAASITWEVTTE